MKDIKKAEPRQENSQNNSTSNKKKHSTMSTVQRACTRYILENPSCNRWQLGNAINRGYAPDVIQYLRRKGLNIITDMKIAHEGNRPIGHYTISPSSRAKAWEMVG